MDQKLGLFVHWGLYAVTGYQEQSRARQRIPREIYHNLIDQFNPVHFDPDAWVDLAWQAGMRYICFTTKHHDGFCMWDTKHTDFNIMNTPYGRDVLRLLADACDRRGMLLSLYYSIPDWNHPNAYNPASSHQCDPVEGDKPDTLLYREYVKNQITELLTNYGRIYTLFWDIPPHIDDPSINELVRRLQPGILINDRGYDVGDFSTPERHVPDGQCFDHPTEACQSVGQQSWGYRTNEDYYSTRLIKASIDKVMAMGGSYLLNVGPMADGRIDDRSAAIVQNVGDWYTRVRESLDNVQPSAVPMEDWYNHSTFIAVEKPGVTYLHFYNGLDTSGVTLCPISQVPAEAIVLNNGERIKAAIVPLPTAWNWQTRQSRPPYLHLFDLPIETFSHEPIVVKLVW